MTEEEDLEDLRRSTRETFDECTNEINYIEAHPIAHDSTYTEILKSSRTAFGHACKARLKINRDPYEANPPIALALMHLKEQRELLDRLLAQDVKNPTIAAIQDVAHKVDEHHKENMNAHGATHARLPKKPRADKGGKHTMRKNRTAASVDGVKHTAEWLAGVLNRSRYKKPPERGTERWGSCTKEKIEQWDKWCADNPGEKTKKWGYCTELRTDAGRYNELMEFIARWAAYWDDRKIKFKEWRANNPKLPLRAFKFKPLRRSDINPARIGRTDDGDLVIEPRPDPRRS